MKCPHCNVNLAMSDKQGIEIDYCPECRGIWLDRGELEKIIEKSNASYREEPRYEEPRREPRYEDQYSHKSHNQDSHYDHDHYKKHRKKSFLENMFDF